MIDMTPAEKRWAQRAVRKLLQAAFLAIAQEFSTWARAMK